nr:hypothetical protein [Microbacterium proteolyticum]
MTTIEEAQVVIRWLERFASQGIVTIGGKGGALETAKEIASDD